MDPANGAVEQHDPDSRSEQFEDPAGLRPFGPEHQAHYVVTDQGKIGSHSHAYEGHNPEGISEIASETGRIVIQPAQGCQGNAVEGRSKLAGRECEKVIGFLVVSKGRRIEFPSDKKIVKVSRKIVCA